MLYLLPNIHLFGSLTAEFPLCIFQLITLFVLYQTHVERANTKYQKLCSYCIGNRVKKIRWNSKSHFRVTKIFSLYPSLSLYKLNNLFFVYISVSKSNDQACIMLTRLISDDLLIFLPLFSFAVPICLYNEGAFFFFWFKYIFDAFQVATLACSNHCCFIKGESAKQ